MKLAIILKNKLESVDTILPLAFISLHFGFGLGLITSWTKNLFKNNVNLK